jgi:hypothetical protein
MTSVFMTYAAVVPVLRTQWGMSATAAGSVSTGFQLGYAVALVAFSAMADRVGARRVFIGSAWLSAVTAIAFGLWARSYTSGLVLYTLMALSQGGTYTTAIMLIADRYPVERRGAAVGWLIASSSAGYALSLLLAAPSLAWGGYETAFLVSADHAQHHPSAECRCPLRLGRAEEPPGDATDLRVHVPFLGAPGDVGVDAGVHRRGLRRDRSRHDSRRRTGRLSFGRLPSDRARRLVLDG